MALPNSPKNQRWYDKQETLSKSVQVLELFPPEYQEVVGNTVIQLAERDYGAQHLVTDPKAIGPDKVLSLFKAKSRQRSFDRSPIIHKAMNYIYVLPDEKRIVIAGQVIEVSGQLFDYFMYCKETNRLPALDTAQVMANAFAQGTLNDSYAFLTQAFPGQPWPNAELARALQNRVREALEHLTETESRALLQQVLPPRTTETAGLDPASLTQGETTSPPTVQPPRKDETLAQDKRDMKIRLDRFGL